MYEDIDVADIDAGELHALYQKEWWTAGRQLAHVEKLLQGSGLFYGVVESNSRKLVAFARVLTDGVFKALIFDVIVDEAHRDRALGQRLMTRMVDDPRLRSVTHLELYCRPELAPFYERFGFSEDNGGVGLMRRTR